MLAGCGRGEPRKVEGFDAIAPDEAVSALGTEPFWHAEIAGNSMQVTTPDSPQGHEIAIRRFAGNGGIGYAGQFEGEPVMLAITPQPCSDGMSDRVYPYTATFQWQGDLRQGCAYTSRTGYREQGAGQ